MYTCNNCKNTINQLDFASTIELCPFCGIILSDPIQKPSLPLYANRSTVIFKKDSSLPKLTLDIPKLDKILHFLTPNNRLCISGIHTQKLIERICVRAQLPHRYGGLDSDVLLIDGANSSDLYMCVNFARQYGLAPHKILEKKLFHLEYLLHTSLQTLINKVSLAIKQYNPKILIITNLLHYFTTDLNSDTTEMKSIQKSYQQLLHDGNIPLKDLIFTNRVTRGTDEHKTNTIQADVINQLKKAGKIYTSRTKDKILST